MCQNPTGPSTFRIEPDAPGETNVNREAVTKAVEQWAANYLISPPELAHGTPANADIMTARMAVMSAVADAVEACDLEPIHCGDAGPSSFVRRLEKPVKGLVASLTFLRGQVEGTPMLASYEQFLDATQRLTERDLQESSMLLAEVCWAYGMAPKFTI